jgi:hypothetical protein
MSSEDHKKQSIVLISGVPVNLAEYEVNLKQITIEQTEDDLKNNEATVHADFIIEKKQQ